MDLKYRRKCYVRTNLNVCFCYWQISLQKIPQSIYSQTQGFPEPPRPQTYHKVERLMSLNILFSLIFVPCVSCSPYDTKKNLCILCGRWNIVHYLNYLGLAKCHFLTIFFITFITRQYESCMHVFCFNCRWWYTSFLYLIIYRYFML